MTQYRNPFRPLPGQLLAGVQNRLDELEGRISGYGGASSGGGPGGGALSRSENLLFNAGLDVWSDATHPNNWQSAAQSNWNTGTNVNREATTLFALPYSAKLGDGSSDGRGMAQAAAFRVTPGQAYAVAARIQGASSGAQYVVLLKAYDSSAAEITTGTPLGSSWAYDGTYGGWKIAGTPSYTSFDLVQATIVLDSSVCWLRCSIQYLTGGSTKYIYVDEVKLSRGQTTEPWALRPVFDTEGVGSGTPNVLTKWSASGLALQDSHFTDDGTFTDLTYGANIALLTVTAYGSSKYPSITGRMARGTASSPTATQSGDLIAEFGARGYQQVTGAFATTARAQLGMFAAENWTNVAQGTYVTLSTTPASSITLTERLRLSAAGTIGFPPYPSILYSWPSSWPAGNYLLQSSVAGVLTWVPPPSGGVSGSGTQYYLAEWTATTSIGNSASIYRDTGISGNPYRATTSRWRFEVMPIQLFNSSSLTPSPTPSLYFTNVYRREDVKAAFTSRLMIMGPDLTERVLVNTPSGTAGRWGCAPYWMPESDSGIYTASTTLGYSAELLYSGGKWYYNGVEINAVGGVGGSGTANYVPRWVSASSLGNSVIIDESASSSRVRVNADLNPWASGSRRLGGSSYIWTECWTEGLWCGSGVDMHDHLYAASHNAYDLGSSGSKFRCIYAVSTSFGDLGFEEKSCPVCLKRFRRGESIGFMVKAVERKGIVTVPKHSSC